MRGQLRCPDCRSTNVTKEYYLGSQTGDYVCNDCETSGPRMYFEDEDEEDDDPVQVQEHLQGRFGTKG